jgi:hypothetical protein
MALALKKYGQVIFAIIGALATIGTALWENGSEGDKVIWLYVFCVWLVLYSALEVYLSKKQK